MRQTVNIENESSLIEYLERSGHCQAGDITAVAVLRGGVSNRTVQVKLADGRQWVLKQALPKLRVKEDWQCDPARIEREATGLIWLGRLAPAGSVPGFVFHDPVQHVLAMEAVPEPHANWKTQLLAGTVQMDHFRQFGHLLARVHCRSREQAGEVTRVFEERRFFEALRLEPYYRFTAARQPGAARFYEQLIEETWATRTSLVHGDYSPKNILLHQERIVLLDHEVIHWGDPAFDLGFALTHPLSKALHLSEARERLIEGARVFWETYRAEAGPLAGDPRLEARAARHTLGCMLARVDGRSPLEYLTEPERNLQRRGVLELMQDPPARVAELVLAWTKVLRA